MYPNLLSSESITAWKAAERFFAEFFSFLFDNTSACYLVSAFFFPTLLPFILWLCYNVYGIEQLVCLSARIYSIPHLVLSQSKINRVITLIWISKQLLCFHTFSSFQNIYLKSNKIIKELVRSINMHLSLPKLTCSFQFKNKKIK